MVNDEQVKELMDKIDQLIKALKDQGKFNYVNIEHADIQGPLVDKMDYTFDKLDVKEVSGALNLGTTFGVKVVERKKSSNSTSTKPQSQTTTTSQRSDRPNPKSQAPSQPQNTSQSNDGKHLQTHSQPQQKNKIQSSGTQKQIPPIQKKKNHVELKERPKQQLRQPEQNNSAGRTRLTFHRRDLKEENSTNNVSSETKNPIQTTLPYAEIEKDITYKKNRKGSKNKEKERELQEEAKSQNQPNENQPVVPKTTHLFSSTKKGFTFKLR